MGSAVPGAWRGGGLNKTVCSRSTCGCRASTGERPKTVDGQLLIAVERELEISGRSWIISLAGVVGYIYLVWCVIRDIYIEGCGVFSGRMIISPIPCFD
jgi:hypothetical protein